MTPFEEAMASPRIGVIDAAIARIERGLNQHSCFALSGAVRSAYRNLSFRQRQLLVARYTAQYRQSAWARDGRPSWWDNPSAGKEPRIAALKNFRQLCLDAAK